MTWTVDTHKTNDMYNINVKISLLKKVKTSINLDDKFH